MINIGGNLSFGKRLHLVTHNKPLVKRLLMSQGHKNHDDKDEHWRDRLDGGVTKEN
ncbi:MAG: hypothetical protein ABFD08_03135 [Syntrophomonas sp.]